MSNWLRLGELLAVFDAEQRIRASRAEMLALYQKDWTNEEWEEMSNRRKLKGTLVDHQERRGFQGRIQRIQNTFVGHYNAYVCAKCDKLYLTLDVDPGVTPMFGPCFATEGCAGQAHSMGYPEGDPPERFGEPIIHWVKPTEQEFKSLPTQIQAHVMEGGLIRKATDAAPDWVKALA